MAALTKLLLIDEGSHASELVHTNSRTSRSTSTISEIVLRPGLVAPEGHALRMNSFTEEHEGRKERSSKFRLSGVL